MRIVVNLVIYFILIAPLGALAVEPDEILADEELEFRARQISQNLRCLVCQNETIDESNAPLAKDLRVIVREQLNQGLSDSEIYQFITDRYGEFVLLKPQINGSNLIIYLAGPMMLVLALLSAVIYVRRRQNTTNNDQPLTENEKQRLNELMRSD